MRNFVQLFHLLLSVCQEDENAESTATVLISI